MGESSDLGSQLSPNTINHYEHSKYSKKSGSNMSDISKPTLNRKPSDVFENTKTKSYSFKANIVPPYVLDTLSQAHYKDQLNNNNVNTNQAEINPAVKSIHVKKSTTHHHSQGNNGNTHNNQTNNNSSPNNNNNNHNNNNNNNGNDDDDYLSFSNDPFIKSMDHNWNKFLSSIQQPSTYTKDLLTFDENTQFENKLEGSWGGEERLKSALLGSPSSDEDTFTNEKSFSVLSILGLFGYKRNKSLNNHLHNKGADESPKVRSKAGYWMSDEKRADLLPSLNRIFVINPLVPLLLRICIMVFSACALALACTIFQYSNNKYEGKKVSQQPSTIMAIIVQCFALVYLVYISYDEYSGKPLGLRAPLGKMRLIMLDLLFIILSSANLSLTFNSLYDDQWVCASDGNIDKSSSNYTPTVASLCRRQRGLAAFLFLILGLWVLTFTISIIRVIDRVSIIGQRND